MGTLTNDFEKMASRTDYLLSRWGSWSRPETRVYNYNIDPTSFQSSYSYSSSSARSARASSVAVGSEMSSSRQMRATTVAPAANPLEGYSGIYGKQLSNLQGRSVSTQQTSAKVSSVSTEQKMERSEMVEKSKVDMIKEHQKSLEYGKNSRSSALRRAEIHAVNSGKDPRHVLVPRNHDDDICKKAADIHMYDTSSMSNAGRVKVEKLEKELNALIASSMSYKSSYAKSARQMASEAMSAFDAEAMASSKKIRKTVVESSSKRAIAV